jgi:hypothetical protein
MDKRDRERLLKELMVFEQEETDLISLYQMLSEVGVTDCLPKEQRAEYSQSLEKLYQESVKHQKAVVELISKYK